MHLKKKSLIFAEVLYLTNSHYIDKYALFLLLIMINENKYFQYL